MKCRNHVSEALRLSTELLAIVDQQQGDCDHDGCMLLDGIVRDCAWKIRQAALQWRLELEEPANTDRGEGPNRPHRARSGPERS